MKLIQVVRTQSGYFAVLGRGIFLELGTTPDQAHSTLGRLDALIVEHKPDLDGVAGIYAISPEKVEAA